MGVKKGTEKVEIIWLEPEEVLFKRCMPEEFIEECEKENIKITKAYIIGDSSKETLNTEKYSASKLLLADIIIVDGYRLPDRLICYARNMSNKKNIYIQHGRYTLLKHKWYKAHFQKKLMAYTLFMMKTFIIKPRETLSFIRQGMKCEYSTGFCYS